MEGSACQALRFFFLPENPENLLHIREKRCRIEFEITEAKRQGAEDRHPPRPYAGECAPTQQISAPTLLYPVSLQLATGIFKTVCSFGGAGTESPAPLLLSPRFGRGEGFHHLHAFTFPALPRLGRWDKRAVFQRRRRHTLRKALRYAAAVLLLLFALAGCGGGESNAPAVSYTHLRAHET